MAHPKRRQSKTRTAKRRTHGQSYSIIYHISDIEVVVAFRYLKQFIGVVIVVGAVLYVNMIGRINRPLQVVETTVTQQCNFARDVDGQLIQIVFCDHGHMDIQVGVVYVGAFHILEKLFFNLYI